MVSFVLFRESYKKHLASRASNGLLTERQNLMCRTVQTPRTMLSRAGNIYKVPRTQTEALVPNTQWWVLCYFEIHTKNLQKAGFSVAILTERQNLTCRTIQTPRSVSPRAGDFYKVPRSQTEALAPSTQWWVLCNPGDQVTRTRFTNAAGPTRAEQFRHR